MARSYFVEDYITEDLSHFSQHQWLNYGDTKLGTGGHDLKLVGVRNWPGQGVEGKWHRPKVFLHGKNCKNYIQQAMKDGFVELRFSYQDFGNGKLAH